jgi:signal transduction histidine kinase
MTPIRVQTVRPLGYVGIIKDLTSERQNEERLRQMRERLVRHEKIAALGRMAAQVAHEVKNPLAGLRLYSLHLKGKIAGKIPASEEKLVDKIIDGIDQLSDTCERVLSFARPITLAPRPVDLDQIISASLALVEPQLTAKRIKVELNLSEVGARTLLDEAAIRSTLINLMLNSIQAMSEGGELKVSTATDDQGLRVEIADTGCGMTEEQAKHMFEPFFTTKSQGLGLGLFFAATIIEQHSGSVDVKSQAGKGTEITIRLPLERGKADGASR